MTPYVRMFVLVLACGSGVALAQQEGPSAGSSVGGGAGSAAGGGQPTSPGSGGNVGTTGSTDTHTQAGQDEGNSGVTQNKKKPGKRKKPAPSNN